MNITNDIVTAYINGYYKPLNENLEELRLTGEKDRVPIILKETEMFLGTLLELKQPKKILEIGTAIGYSAIYFATKCPSCEVYTIEKDEMAYQAAKTNIETFGLSQRIHQFLGDGEEQIDKIKDMGIMDFDFVFIDAAKSHYKRFLESSLNVALDNTLVVSDNILQKAMTASDIYDEARKHKTNIRKMREYVEFICHDPELSTSLLSVGDGLALSIYRK